MKQRTLIAPLHWGLGHAARCVPIIKQEIEAGNEVLIAASSGQQSFLEDLFPDCLYLDIPFMEITYPKDGNMVRHFGLRSWKLIKAIWSEHQHLKKLVTEHKLTKVISDSRFGLWHKTVPSYFISHQIEIQTPVFQGIVNWLNRMIMNRYNQVWIPDYEIAPGLAGRLSHPLKMPKRYRYIGPLSRFEHVEANELTQSRQWDAVAVISGPEPQRQLFEAEITRRFIESGEKALILQGKPHSPKKQVIDNITVMNHLAQSELAAALASAKKVISRSGYSSIMDFHKLRIEAEYFATPGQTEQEYLAQLHQNK